jgi:hypothetical protein
MSCSAHWSMRMRRRWAGSKPQLLCRACTLKGTITPMTAARMAVYALWVSMTACARSAIGQSADCRSNGADPGALHCRACLSSWRRTARTRPLSRHRQPRHSPPLMSRCTWPTPRTRCSQGRQATADVRVLAGVHICSSRGGPGCKTDHTTTYSRGHYSTATAPVVPRRQVLELQSRLDDKEVQLAAMGQQLQAAGLQPVDAQQLPLVVRASLADISNVGSRTPRHASPKKDSMQVTLDASAVPSPPPATSPVSRQNAAALPCKAACSAGMHL